MSFLSFFAKLFNSNSKHCKCKSCNRQKTAVGLSMLAAGFCYCQNCDLQVYGQILDLHENSPLSFAVIEVIDSDYKDFSDSDGFFLLRNLCSGKIKIKISHPSCNDFFEELNIDNSISKKFYLEHHVESLEEVILDQSRLNQLSTTAKTYSLSDLQKDQYSGRGLAKALEQISGVNILNTGNVISKPMIHGMFGSRVGIIYDGVQIENQQWGQDHAPNIDQNAFENIQLIKGAGVLKYSGDTAGGVIVLESELPKINDSLYGKSIVSGMSNGRGLNLTSSWTKSYNSGNYFKVQAMMKRMGDLSTPNYILSNTGTDENNISFSFGRNKIVNRWKTNFSFFSQKIGILRSSHIGNVGDLVYAIELASPTIIMPFSHDINPPYQSNKHYTAGIEYIRSNYNKEKFNFKYSWQRNNRKEYDVRRASFKDLKRL